MGEVFFSVIIPTYNRSGLVCKSVESLLGQTYPHFEVIVVDDGGTDNTADLIQALNNPIVRYFKTENRERGAARNYGLSLSKGDYVVFLDSDDVMYDHCLNLASNFIRDNGNPEVFNLAHEVRDKNNRLIETTIHIENINSVLIKGNPLACINVFIRKDVSRNFLFNENRGMAGFEDWELWLRLASHYPIRQVKTISGLMLEHADRSSNNQTDKDKLIKRVELFMETVLSNKDIIAYYEKKIHLFRCGCYTYIALHIALTKTNKNTAMQYLLKGLRLNPGFIFEKRFGAIVKHLLF